MGRGRARRCRGTGEHRVRPFAERQWMRAPRLQFADARGGGMWDTTMRFRHGDSERTDGDNDQQQDGATHPPSIAQSLAPDPP